MGACISDEYDDPGVPLDTILSSNVPISAVIKKYASNIGAIFYDI